MVRYCKTRSRWNELRELWLLDRITTLCLKETVGMVKVFSKDVKAIIKDSEKMGYSADLMKAVISKRKDTI